MRRKIKFNLVKYIEDELAKWGLNPTVDTAEPPEVYLRKDSTPSNVVFLMHNGMRVNVPVPKMVIVEELD